MTDLVSVVRSLPEALERWAIELPEMPGQVLVNGDDWPVMRTAASLLAELFAVCPNCDGSGVDDPTPNFSESHPLPCPSCHGGVVIKPEAIKKAAKALPHPLSAWRHLTEMMERDYFEGMAEAALWAVFGDGDERSRICGRKERDSE